MGRSLKSNLPFTSGNRPEFMQHIQWSAEPDITMIETGALPVIAFRHWRTRADTTVELIANAPQDEDWDALFCNRSGSGRYEVDFCGEHHAMDLHRDLCCFIPAGADTRLQFDPRSGSFSLYFKPGALAALLSDDGKQAPEPAPIVGRHLPRVARLMGMVEQELRRPNPGARLMIDGLLRAIAALLANNDAALGSDAHKRIHIAPAKLKRVMDFIEANLNESIGLDDLAREADLSVNHFLRVFKLATGETPYHYLRARRLERARQLLTEDAMPLAELALECGFANQAHFTAAFSKEVGISPGRYRRAHI